MLIKYRYCESGILYQQMVSKAFQTVDMSIQDPGFRKNNDHKSKLVSYLLLTCLRYLTKYLSHKEYDTEVCLTDQRVAGFAFRLATKWKNANRHS